MTELYRAGGQLIKVRIWLFISFVTALAFCWWGWDIFTTYGTRPADGGVLASFWIRLPFGGIVALLGVAFAAGMALYSKSYVASIAYDRDRDRVIVRTPAFIGNRRHSFARSDIKGVGFNRGLLVNPVGVSVDAPWYSLKVAGRRSAYIVDGQGQWLDPDLAMELFAPPAKPSRKPKGA